MFSISISMFVNDIMIIIRKREEKQKLCLLIIISIIIITVSCHNFKSQNFKLSVSNPKSKYVAYLSVLSQISNYQGLGRKNKHEILKTDRTKGVIVGWSQKKVIIP